MIHGNDPLSPLPAFQWNFLPFSAYLFALEIKTGLPWAIAGKLLPVACEVATIWLVGYFAEHPTGPNVRMLYALCPLAILVTAWHGQLEPITIMLALVSLLIVNKHQVWAGVALGFAVASKSWPLLVVPGAQRQVELRRWWRVALPAAVVLFGLLISIPVFLHDSVLHAVKVILSYRSFVGTWGWSRLLRLFGLLASLYIGFFYLYAFPRNASLTSWPSTVLVVSSIALIAAAVASMPWDEISPPSHGRHFIPPEVANLSDPTPA